MVQEFTDLQDRQQIPAIQSKETKKKYAKSSSTAKDNNEPSFRAYLLSKDARLPLEVQRSNLASRSATTLLYLHGGGFSLGSVAFYAEALLRIRAKVCALEALEENKDNVAEARCVAVEYDLSPAARFPTPLLQCLRCYAHLIEVEKLDPNNICIAGDSAGGNLTMGMLLCLDGQMKNEPLLAERDWSKLPMPGKALLISPWVDLRPSHAHAFSLLRASRNDKEAKEIKTKADGANIKQQDQGWADAVAAYEWDYVASEALLHYAQVYSGVLPNPRRVRGPMGWIAQVCGVIAADYEKETKGPSLSNAYMDPMGALSALIRPSKKLAQATHDILSDPFFSSMLGLKDVDISPETDLNQAINFPPGESASTFEPLFTASDRKADVVANKRNLYVPIGHLHETQAEKIGMEKDQKRQEQAKAEKLLDSHALISPAIGDWRNIKLKGGILVTWGERERMSDDIEAWVDGIYQDANNDQNAPPAQDGESQPKQTSRNVQEDEEASWIETAVERGPGGVHVWPLLSMYLAGTEAERERGLDFLAGFIARSPSETATIASQSLEDQVSNLIDPPHAAPDSPVSETASVGSMPSDVDLHGLVDEEYQELYQDPAAAFDIAEAVRKANEFAKQKNVAESKVYKLGLGPSNKSKPSIAQTTSLQATAEEKSIVPPIRTVVQGRTLGIQTQRPTLSPRNSMERERGRSRSPCRTEVLSSQITPSSSASSSSSNHHPHFSSPARLHRPNMIPSPVRIDTNSSQRSDTQGQRATPLWRTSSASSTTVGPDSRPESDGNTRQEAQEEDIVASRPGQDLDKILEASFDEATSSIMSTSPPPKQDEEEEAAPTMTPLDISHFGLSHYAIRRPEPEGLSDIAEEGSVLSASITSAGGIASRSLSPEDRYGDGRPQTSLTGASKRPREQEWNDRGQRPRWPVEEEQEQLAEEQSVGHLIDTDLAFSPPANPQPGASIPLIQNRNVWKSTDDLSLTAQDFTASPSGSSQSLQHSPSSHATPRKKPKGDVWW